MKHSGAAQKQGGYLGKWHSSNTESGRLKEGEKCVHMRIYVCAFMRNKCLLMLLCPYKHEQTTRRGSSDTCSRTMFYLLLAVTLPNTDFLQTHSGFKRWRTTTPNSLLIPVIRVITSINLLNNYTQTSTQVHISWGIITWAEAEHTAGIQY